MGIIETIQTEILQAAEAKGIEQGMEKGIEKGIEQGIEMGRYKAEMNMIFKLLEKGLSLAQIHEMLDFSHELITQAKQELDIKKSLT